MTIFDFDGAVLALFDEDSGSLEPTVTRWSKALENTGQKIHFSRTIAKKVFDSGKAVIAADASRDIKLSSESIIAHHIRSVACVPLKTRERIWAH